MADASKNLLALLNGLAKRHYYDETEFTDDFLKSQIYENLNEEEFSEILQKCTSMMKSLVSADMDFNQLEAYLTSQMKRREGAITEDQANVYRKFWKTHKNKIHDSLIAKSNWNNSLKKVSWRIDVKSQTKNSDDPINEPTAIVELQIDGGAQNTKESEIVQFEMDESKLLKILQNMKDIEDEIEKNCQE